MGEKESVVLMGRIAAPYGIKGWVRISSFAQPLDNIFAYGPWQLKRSGSDQLLHEVKLLEGKTHGKGLVARLAEIDDRDKADALKGLEIHVARSQLPDPDDGRFYWADLEGLRVERVDGGLLGHVDQMLEAGAADVMVVCGDNDDNSRYLIPFIRDEVIKFVDLEKKLIQVDWEFEG